MLCTKKSAVKTAKQFKSETQYELDSICNKCKNVKLRFLILLYKHDFKKWCISKKDMILYFRNKFPGYLTIESYDDVNELPCSIEEPVMPYQIYIMLPKEKIYVPSDQFTGRYIRSKMQELIKIFVTLRATSIKYIRYDTNDDHQTLTTELRTDVPQISISDGIKYENSNSKKTGVEYELKLTPSNEPIDISIFSNCSFYYLKRTPAWQDIILRRIDNGVVFDKYTYWNREREFLKTSFTKQMEWFNLSANYDWEKYKDLMVDYTVVYEDVPHIKKIITPLINSEYTADHHTIDNDNDNNNSKKDAWFYYN